jgi:hypothetical protein
MMSSLTSHASGISNKTTQPPKQVRFSEYSTLQLYHVHQSYRHQKAYLKSDYKSFRDRAASEASQLRRLVEASSLQPVDAVQLFIHNGIISRENLIGLENLIVGNSSGIDERCVHSQLLLDMQKALKESNDSDSNYPILTAKHSATSLCDTSNLLAQVSSARSANSAQMARVRAALAA